MRDSSPSSAKSKSRTQIVLALISIGVLLCLAWPGVRTARADESIPSPGQSAEPDASYDGFVQSISSEDQGGRVVETVGPACGDGSNISAELQQQRAMARVRAQMMAEMRARQARGEQPEVVVLNNRGYNYRSLEEEAAASPPSPAEPHSKP